MATTNDLLGRVRTLIDDVAGDKSVFKENLTRSVIGNQVDGASKNFQLNNRRIVATTLQVSADGAAFAPAASEDDLRGRFTLSTAPATSLLATYDFQFFNDTEITDFLTQAGSFVGSDDITQVATGLLDALVFKAASDAARALSMRSAPFFTAAAGGKSMQKGDISKKYADLANKLLDAATAERQAFYGDRKGLASSPAYGQFATRQTPWTPKR